MNQEDKDNIEERVGELEKKMPPAMKRLTDLYHSKGYATAYVDLIRMLNHVYGKDGKDAEPNVQVPMQAILSMIEMATNTLPLYQEFLQSTGQKSSINLIKGDK